MLIICSTCNSHWKIHGDIDTDTHKFTRQAYVCAMGWNVFWGIFFPNFWSTRWINWNHKRKLKTKIFFLGVNKNWETFLYTLNRGGQEKSRRKKVFFFILYNKVEMLSTKNDLNFYHRFTVCIWYSDFGQKSF